MWEVRRGKKVPEKKKWKVEKEEMYNILVCDDDREIAIIKSEELYNNFKRNLEYEKNRHNECCDECSPSTC